MNDPQQARSRESTARMVGAVLELIVESGLGSVSASKVAERAGVSNGALFHRFSSTMELISAAQDHFLSGIEQSLGDELHRMRPRAGVSAMRGLVDIYMDVFITNAQAFQAFMIEGRLEPQLKARGGLCACRCERAVCDWLKEIYGHPVEAGPLIGRTVASLCITNNLWHMSSPDGVESGSTRSRELLAQALHHMASQASVSTI